MQTHPPHTALLVFIRSAEEEARHKCFGRGLSRRANRRIAALLNRRVLAMARRSGLPCFVVRSAQQRGATFGERFTHAVEGVFAQGFERVLAIGNDCLRLDAGTLRRAAQALEGTEALAGPACDGGVYLLGLHRAAFQAEAFQKLPWQTEALFEAFQKYCSQRGSRLVLVPPAHDADDAASLLNSLAELGFEHPLRRRLLPLLHASPQPLPASTPPPALNPFLFVVGLRAPPFP